MKDYKIYFDELSYFMAKNTAILNIVFICTNSLKISEWQGT